MRWASSGSQPYYAVKVSLIKAKGGVDDSFAAAAADSSFSEPAAKKQKMGAEELMGTPRQPTSSGSFASSPFGNLFSPMGATGTPGSGRRPARGGAFAAAATTPIAKPKFGEVAHDDYEAQTLRRLKARTQQTPSKDQ